MTESTGIAVHGMVVEEEVHLTLVELCRVVRAPEDQVLGWVDEGVLEPIGDSPAAWRFAGQSLRRARTAVRLARDLGLNTPGVALALDLLEEIASLRARLQGAGTAGS